MSFSNPPADPLVTVVVPLYNEEQFVRECLESIRRQSYQRIECLVVNDASTDGSRQIALEFASHDQRFRVIDHESNQGLPATRNTGLSEAKGEFVTFLDSDDFLIQHSIWRRVLTLERERGPHVAGAYCRTLQVPEKPSRWQVMRSALRPVRGPKKDFISCRGDCPFSVHAVLLKTKVVRKFGGFDASMRNGAEDWDLWLRLMRHGFVFVPAGFWGAIYRQKRASMIRALVHCHALETTRLIAGAHAPLQEAEVVADTPFVYSRPLAHYEEVITRTKRLVRFAAIAWLGGDQAAVSEILELLEPNSFYYLKRHVNLSRELEQGYRRFCSSGGSDAARPAGWASGKKALLDLVMARISSEAVAGKGSPEH